METGKKEGCSRKEWSWQEPKGLLFHRSPSLTPELPSITYHFPFPNSAHLRRVVTCCLQILFSLFFSQTYFCSLPLPFHRDGCRQGHQWPLCQTASSPYLPCPQHLTQLITPSLKHSFLDFQGTSGLSFSLLAGPPQSSLLVPPHLPDLLTVNRSQSSITDSCSLSPLAPLLILSSISNTFY